ncbi:MAG: SIMPL domain-containing protein [Candidatus Eisenbacteria bacterium]
MKREAFWSAVVVGLSIVIAGIAVGVGFYKARASERYVTVKGLAEREVDADLAVWPITFKAAVNDLAALQRVIDTGRGTITAFLLEAGFAESDISSSAPRVTDTEAERARGMETRSQYRYAADATVTARTRDVDLVKRTMERSGELVGKGVALAAYNWETPTEFLFTSLNEIKPEMIEEATKDARKAAEKFARDSGSKMGKIRRATQGYFSIEDRDRNSPEVKKVRVVTTIDYYLVD